MALQSLAGGLIRWPSVQIHSVAQQVQAIDADGEYTAAVMVNPTARTIRGFAVNVIGLTASGSLRFTAETVSANLPTGTLVDAAATVDVNVTGTGLVKADFGANITIPAGDVAFRVRRVSGTFNGNLVNIGNGSSVAVPPHIVMIDAQVDGRGTSLAAPFAGVPPDETYLPFPFAMPVNNGQSLPGIPAGEEYGTLISIPFRCRASGLVFHGRHNVGAPSQNPEARLYSSDGSTIRGSGAFLRQIGLTVPHYVPFDTPVEIAAGENVYAVLHAFDDTNWLGLYCWDLLDRAMAETVGLGHLVTRTGSSGAWTDNDKVPMMALVLDRLDDGVQVAPEYPGLGQPIVGVFAQPKLVGVLA